MFVALVKVPSSAMTVVCRRLGNAQRVTITQKGLPMAPQSQSMRAIAFPEFGAAPAARELPVPVPGPGEVLVQVRASSINGFDLGVLGGYLQGRYEYEFPVVLGKDYAGVVAAFHQALPAGAIRHRRNRRHG